jgi:hypothetical protein
MTSSAMARGVLEGNVTQHNAARTMGFEHLNHSTLSTRNTVSRDMTRKISATTVESLTRVIDTQQLMLS